jgi:hypothetical protein
MQRDAFGARLGYSTSSIASFEQGYRTPPPRFIERADRLLDADGVLEALREEVARAQYPALFRDMARLEAEAAELVAYDAHVVNGLLQIEEYMRALLPMRRPLETADKQKQQKYRSAVWRQK